MKIIQQSKGIENLSELDFIEGKSASLVDIYTRFLQQFNLGRINKLLESCKGRGVDPKSVFQVLFMLSFASLSNIRSLMRSGYSSQLAGKKDVYYSFLSNPEIAWRKILTLFARQFISLVKRNSVDGDNDCPRCLIIDDSTLDKCGKKIEFIGKVFDHCSHSYKLGMKLLALGFWDGKSFIPIDFSIHNEPGKKKNRGLKSVELKKQYSKKRNPEVAVQERIGEISKSKIEVALEMIKRAVKNGFTPKYILADSWFITDHIIKSVVTMKRRIAESIHIIGLMKTNRIITLNNKRYRASKIPELKRKQIKKCTKLKCFYIPLTIAYKGTRLKAFFVRMNGQQNWKLLITTDSSLSFIKAMQYYQIRWSIEVFFKDTKQNLLLGKCQSTDFDAHIATTSIIFMNYILLALNKRFQSYESVGEIFKAFKNKILEDTIIVKVWEIIVNIYTKILADLGVDWDFFIRQVINQIVNKQLIKSAFTTLFQPEQNLNPQFNQIISET